MKMISGSALLLAVLAVGCAKESPPGGPGASKPSTTPPATPGAPGAPPTTTANGNHTDKHADRNADKNSFTVKVPGTDVDVKQGDTKDVTISISRGSDFKQAVTLKIEAPAGITVAPAEVSLPPTDDKVKVKIEADAAAAPGPQAVKVTAIPETGDPTSETFTVQVNEKK